jgi:TP901 family phage tail tape measure protein
MALKVGELYASFGIDASELDKALSGIEQKCSNLSSSMTKTGAVMSAAITAPLVKVGKEIYEAGTSFYSQMSRVEAISGANATQMEALTAKAIEMGSTTSFTATEAGKALEYMAMAGWKSDEMQAGLAPIMDLAAASGEELAATSDIVTDALTAFGLTANDAAMFSDVLAAAATNSNTNVGMMGETFKYLAPVAGALGYTIQDTAVAIGLMANSGIKGSQAGTALRNVLTNMAKPTDTVQAAMDKLGVSLTDASGSVIPLNQVLTTMRGSFSQLSEAEKTQYATMLGGKYGMSGLLAIVNATDEEFQSLTDSINDAEGATSRMAAAILDNAQGDVTIFKSAVEGLEITLWGLVEGPFRSIVQTATKWVDSFRKMDSATQVAVLKVGALAAAIGPALIMGGRVVKIVGKLIPLMHALASPVGIITGALALFAVAAVDANNDIGKSFVRMSKKVGGSLKKVNAKIQGKMQTVSKRMPALCASIVEGVQNIVPEFMDTALLAVTGMMDTISDNASNIAEIGKTIITSILGGISKNLPSLISSGAKMMTSIASALIRNIPTLVQSVAQIAAAIWNGLKNTNWVALGKEILAAIDDALQDAIVVGIKGLGNLAVNIVEALGTVLAGINWGDLTVSLDGFASMLVNGIVEGIKALYSAGADIVQAVGDVLSKVDWTQLGKAAQAIGGTLINGIVEGLKAMTTGAADIFSAIADMFGKISWSEIGGAAGDIAKSLIDSLVSGLGDLSESGGISDLITALGDAIVSAASGLATAASTLVGELVAYLLDPANLLKLGEVGLQFVGEIVKGVLNLGTNMIYGAADVLTNTIVGFFRGIFGIKVDPYVEQMMNQFYDLEFDVPTDLFDGYGKACGAALMMAMEGAFSNTKQLEEAVYSWGVVVESGYAQFVPQFEYLGNESVVSLYRGFLNGMETGSATAEQSAREAALLIGLGYGENLENALEAHYPAVSDALAEMFEDNNYIDLKQLASEFGFEIGDLMGFSIPEGYALAIVDGTPTIISKSQELLAAGEAAIAEGWNADELMAGLWDYTFQTTFAEIDKWKPELTQILEDMGVEAGSLLGVALPDGVAEGLKNGTMSVEQAAAAIAAAAVVTQADVNKSIADNASRGEETGEAVATGEDNAKGTVGDASTGLHDTVTGAFVPLPQELTDTTNEAMAGMETSILDGQAPNEAAALEVSDAVVKKFILNMSETNGKEIGTKFVNAIKSAVTSCKSSLASEADSAARAAVSAASSVLTNGVGSSIGYNFAQGIANGIRAGSSVIRAAARSAAQSALSAAKSSLGIHSPSTVAEREIGWMWDAGLAKGVLGKVQLIEKAAGDVTDSLHDSFLVGDPSRGTVYTSGDTIRQTAKQPAEASNEKQSLYEKAEAIGRVIADRLIESGALDGDVIMDGDKVGEKVSNPVSKTISKKSRQTVAGRSAQGVIA